MLLKTRKAGGKGTKTCSASSEPGHRGLRRRHSGWPRGTKDTTYCPWARRLAQNSLRALMSASTGIPCLASVLSAGVSRGLGMPRCEMSHLPGRSWCVTVKSTPREISALEKVKRSSATPAFLLCPEDRSRPSFPRIFPHTSSPAPCWTVPDQPSPESHLFPSTCTVSKFWPSHHSVRFQNRFLTHVPDTTPSANLPPNQDSIERWSFANFASCSFSPLPAEASLNPWSRCRRLVAVWCSWPLHHHLPVSLGTMLWPFWAPG